MGFVDFLSNFLWYLAVLQDFFFSYSFVLECVSALAAIYPVTRISLTPTWTSWSPSSSDRNCSTLENSFTARYFQSLYIYLYFYLSILKKYILYLSLFLSLHIFMSLSLSISPSKSNTGAKKENVNKMILLKIKIMEF